MNPLIITGYHERTEEDRKFARIWYYNTVQAPYNGDIYVFETKGSAFPGMGMYSKIVHIPTHFNLGHVGDLLSGKEKHAFCGWSASVLAGALIAYNCGKDMIYKEGDCLAFGPWIPTLYSQLGDGKFIFGRKHQSAPWMPCSQALFLIKHDYIPTFVERYLALGTDNDPDNLPEHKFIRLMEQHPEKVKQMTIGYDRERPICYYDEVWYGQKFTEEEMAELHRREMI